MAIGRTLDSRRTPRFDPSPTTRRRLRVVWRYWSVWAMVLLFVFPFLVMVTTAFKNPSEVFSAPPTLLPESWTWQNFTEAFDDIPFWRYLANTTVIAGLSVLGTVLCAPLTAYALSKISWFGSRPLLILVLLTMMLPPQVTMIPVYLIWNGLGAVGTILPLITPSFIGVPFFIFLIRQFLANVSDELIEAGRLDGASELRIYAKIVLPIARPAIVTAAIFQFVWAWTDFLNPLIYLSDPEDYTLSIGLFAFFGENDVAWGPLMAASVLFTLPAVFLFLVGQRFFIGGVSAGALK